MNEKVVSLFAGIEGIGLGLERAGMKVIAQVEIDKSCIKVLERRYPNVPRYRDVREYLRGDEPPPDADVVTGGVPCQDISVAGKRAGLAGERSGLFFEFVRIVDRLAPTWVLFENVAGLLSSASATGEDAESAADDEGGGDYHAGADFAVLLGELTGFTPDVPDGGWRRSGVCVGPKRAAAWRLLDSQYFGVPQRRKRVFVVCHPRADIAAKVLLEPESGQGDPPPSRKPGQEVAGILGLGTPGSRGIRSTDLDGHGAYIPEVAYAVRASQEKQNGSPERGDVTLVSTPKAYGIHGQARRSGISKTPSRDAEGRRRLRNASAMPIYEELSPTIDRNGKHMVAMAVDGSDVANTLKRDDGYVSEDGTGRQPGFVIGAGTLRMREGKPGGGKGPLISEDRSLTLATANDQVVFYNVQPVSSDTVRNALEAHATETDEAITKTSSKRSERGTMAVYRKSRRAANHDDAETWVDDGVANTVTPFDQGDVRATTIAAVDEMTVRRLTVTEQERLQGFPDGWTHLCDNEPYDSSTCECPDSPRVGAIGNAVTVNVAEWIGRRMVQFGGRDT